MKGKNKLQGRGLDQIFGGNTPVPKVTPTSFDDLKEDIVGRIPDIEIKYIIPNENQPRRVFDEEEMEELKASIQSMGVVTAITVRPHPHKDMFEIISGERRWRAARAVGLDTIPCLVRTADDTNTFKMAMVENTVRQDLNPMDIATGYQSLLSDSETTQEKLSDEMGIKRTTIANYVRLLKLSPETQNALRSGQITQGHGRSLLSLERDQNEQNKALRQVIDNKLSVRQTEALVTKLKSNKPILNKRPATLPEKYSPIIDRLSHHLSTDLSVRPGAKGKGKIIIPFHSDKDLERIVSLVTSSST